MPWAAAEPLTQVRPHTDRQMPNQSQKDSFSVAGRTFTSRLLVGTGKYKDMQETRAAIDASGAEIVTIAVRRTNLG
jgi:thiazole synthase